MNVDGDSEIMIHDQENEINYNIFAYTYIKKIMIS